MFSLALPSRAGPRHAAPGRAPRCLATPSGILVDDAEPAERPRFLRTEVADAGDPAADAEQLGHLARRDELRVELEAYGRGPLGELRARADDPLSLYQCS